MDALEERVAALEAAMHPQRLAETVSRAWDPKGQEPRIIDADGVTLAYEPAVQLMGGTSTIDPVTQRVIYTPTGGGGTAAAAGVSHYVGGGIGFSAGTPAGVPGLACAVDVPDDGSGSGLVLYSYCAVWQAFGNGVAAAIKTDWDVRVDGAQIFPATDNNPANVRPTITLVSINNARYIHTAPPSVPSSSTGPDTTAAGGLSVSGPQAGGTIPVGLLPSAPILIRLAAGAHTIDVYWTTSPGGTNDVIVQAAAAMALPLGA